MGEEIFTRLEANARRSPQAVAIREGNPDGGEPVVLTRADLIREIGREARRVEREVPPGGAVFLEGGNQVRFAVRFLGALRAGRCVFPFHPDLTRAERDDLARQTGAGAPDGANLPPGSLLLTSSGTTGGPKIVLREAESLDAVAQNVATAVGLSAEDRVLAAIPLFHSYGIENALLAPLLAGAAIEILPDFEPAVVLERIRAGAISVLPGVPLILESLTRCGDGACPAGALRAVYSAAAPLPLPVAEGFGERFGVRVGQLYGATELGSVTYLPGDRPGYEPGCVGWPMEGVEIEILAAPEADATSTEGEVAIRAPSMLSRYLGDDPLPMSDGFFRTGDLGRLDDRGALTITGRLKLLVDIGGTKVNPLEVEAVLALHPGVRECAVLPIPGPGGVSRMKAWVALEEGADTRADDLRAFARERLAPFKIPRTIEIVPDLPRSATGKVIAAALIPSRPGPGA